MKSKKKFNLKKEYMPSFNYIKESKNFIYFSVFIFFLFSLIGFIFPIPSSLESQILEFIKQLIEQTKGLNNREMIQFIFFNNLQSSFFGMILGMIFGIFPLIALIFNGYLLGFVASKSVASQGFLVLWRLFPHGIFELPAVFISLGLGLKLGSFIFQENKIKTLRYYFWNSLRVFIFVVLPLLILAAIIEGTLISYFG